MLADKILQSRHLRFIGGSIICAGINNVILIVGDYIGLGYVLLTFICYAASGSVGYVYHARITFRSGMSFGGYVNFILGISLGLPVSLIILAVLADWLSWPMWLAAPTMTVLMFAYHYMIARLAIMPRLVASPASACFDASAAVVNHSVPAAGGPNDAAAAPGNARPLPSQPG